MPQQILEVPTAFSEEFQLQGVLTGSKWRKFDGYSNRIEVAQFSSSSMKSNMKMQ
ncbi:hypothetical protein MA16_Dca007219 [Dendrobium catenatum]|uniref:Uncharacterized protein n=1 Tax=Dendrobium catenatum TaxID=906689 RepID=A0A2I0W6D7_9ASPA|nr:hypothetical protein MA16_Dca007219 [Dendrobium catenatum]